MRQIHVREKHLSYPLLALAEDVVSTLDRYLPYEGQDECLKLRGKVLAASFLDGVHATECR